MVLYASDVVDRKVSNILFLLDKDGCDLLERCSRFLRQQLGGANGCLRILLVDSCRGILGIDNSLVDISKRF